MPSYLQAVLKLLRLVNGGLKATSINREKSKTWINERKDHSNCIFVLQVYKCYLKSIMLFNYARKAGDMSSDSMPGRLKALLAKNGYSEFAAEEMWKWYDYSAKKGVASF